MRNAGLDELQAEIKIGRSINNLRNQRGTKVPFHEDEGRE